MHREEQRPDIVVVPSDLKFTNLNKDISGNNIYGVC